ncbi:HAD family hydrolase [Mucilaginibacter sp. KACC 22063]|uniref:HAD family hydrolase n=1 Tax=Mucilaginibacter sp. KACC 22063 TaxID=3025666 RepID=UPI002365E23F|nr:HAD family phosphatase [Mucilaginibacter sp. KACC 22063]WDF55337.1 HAD family phosphatase [Mucilaginibacter sp. KACC 22063]
MTTTIIFDLGAVLIDWNPVYLYRKLFDDETQMQHFLANITTSDWNEEQDAGRSLHDGTELLISRYPEHEDNIRAFYGRWEEMLGGPIDATVEIFRKLKESGQYKIYALTNWSAETFGIARERYDFLNWFDGIVMSGEEKMRKPFSAFYQILLDRYQVNPSEALFIDDNARNVAAAIKMGIPSIHFTTPEALKEELTSYGIAV